MSERASQPDPSAERKKEQEPMTEEGSEQRSEPQPSAASRPSAKAKANESQRSSPMPLGDRNQNPEGLGFWQLIGEDYRTHERELLEVGFWAVALHRFGNWRMGLPRVLRPPFTLLYRFCFRCMVLCFGVDLPYNMRLGRRVRIWHHGGIFVGARSIGDDVHIRHNVTIGVLHRDEADAKPVIGNRVDIGPGAAILGPIKVGDDVVIGANSVVVRDVPDEATFFGVPARPVKMLPGAGAARTKG